MEVREKILEEITDIQKHSERGDQPVNDDSQIVQDLGFTSLDVAELIANLEMEFDVDPFSNGVSLMKVRTFGDFCRVYQEAFQEKA